MRRTAHRLMGHPLLTAFACASIVAMVGCSAKPPKQLGVRIGDETLKQFEAGITTESWLLAVLGPPTSSSVVTNIENTKVFRYALGNAPGGLGALFSGQPAENTAVVYFIITDGIVTRFWADRAVETTLLGKPVESPAGEKQGGG